MAKKLIMSLVIVAAFLVSSSAHAAVGGSNPRPQAVGGSNPRPQAVGGSNPRPQAVGGSNPRPQSIAPVSTGDTGFLTAIENLLGL